MGHMGITEWVPNSGPPFMTQNGEPVSTSDPILAVSPRPFITCMAIHLNCRCVILHFPCSGQGFHQQHQLSAGGAGSGSSGNHHMGAITDPPAPIWKTARCHKGAISKLTRMTCHNCYISGGSGCCYPAEPKTPTDQD